MGPGPVKGYEDALRRAADSFLVRLENDPKHYRQHTKLSVAHVILGTCYSNSHLTSLYKVWQIHLLWRSHMGWA